MGKIAKRQYVSSLMGGGTISEGNKLSTLRWIEGNYPRATIQGDYDSRNKLVSENNIISDIVYEYSGIITDYRQVTHVTTDVIPGSYLEAEIDYEWLDLTSKDIATAFPFVFEGNTSSTSLSTSDKTKFDFSFLSSTWGAYPAIRIYNGYTYANTRYKTIMKIDSLGNITYSRNGTTGTGKAYNPGFAGITQYKIMLAAAMTTNEVATNAPIKIYNFVVRHGIEP